MFSGHGFVLNLSSNSFGFMIFALDDEMEDSKLKEQMRSESNFFFSEWMAKNYNRSAWMAWHY
jgi:hypothetical protein